MSFATQEKLIRKAFCPRTLVRNVMMRTTTKKTFALHIFHLSTLVPPVRDNVVFVSLFLQFYYSCLNKAAERMFAGVFYSS